MIEIGGMEAAAQQYDAMISSSSVFAGTPVPAFTARERACLSFLLNDEKTVRSEELLNEILNEERATGILPYRERAEELAAMLKSGRSACEAYLIEKFSQEEYAFAGLFIDYLTRADQSELNGKADAFLTAYPGSRFEKQIRDVIRDVRKVRDRGFRFCAGPAARLYGGNIGDSLTGGPGIELGAGLDMGAQTFDIFIDGYPAEKTAKDLADGTGLKKGTDSAVYAASLCAGRTILKKWHMEFTPHIGYTFHALLAGGTLNSGSFSYGFSAGMPIKTVMSNGAREQYGIKFRACVSAPEFSSSLRGNLCSLALLFEYRWNRIDRIW